MAREKKQSLEQSRRIDLAKILGARGETSAQMLSLYIPNKDRAGGEIGTQRRWVLEAARLLAEIGGGVTILPPSEGGWQDEEEGRLIWEHPVVVYTYVKAEPFEKNFSALRSFVHRLGRETNQGEVVVEFDGRFFRIAPPYDPA